MASTFERGRDFVANLRNLLGALLWRNLNLSTTELSAVPAWASVSLLPLMDFAQEADYGDSDTTLFKTT